VGVGSALGARVVERVMACASRSRNAIARRSRTTDRHSSAGQVRAAADRARCVDGTRRGGDETGRAESRVKVGEALVAWRELHDRTGTDGQRLFWVSFGPLRAPVPHPG